MSTQASTPARRGFWRRYGWALALLLVAAVGVGVLLWNPAGQRPTLAPAARGTPQPAAEPKTGGTYTEALVGALGRLNPLFDHLNPADRDVNRLLYRGLLRFDARGLPQPDLAEAWGIAKDGKTYNLALRRDAVWHDGTPITAADVLFTIDLMRRDDLPVDPNLRTLWQQVEVQALDAYTIQFRLKEPFAPFLDYLTFGLLPKHVWEGIAPEEMVDAAPNLMPVGNGPFRFDHFLVRQGQLIGIVLKTFDDFYLGRPYLDEFVFRYYDTPQAALEAYQKGEVLGLAEVTPDVLPQALQAPRLNFYTARLPRLTLVLFNLRQNQAPFLAEASVRRALLLALNRERMIKRVLHSQGMIADSPIFPGTWAYDPQTPRVPYDPDAAARLLDEAGYVLGDDGVRAKEGARLRFTLSHPNTATHTQLAREIQRDWARIGVEVTLQPLPYERLIADRLEPRNYQAALVDLDFSRSPDPDPYVFWHKSQVTEGQNYSGWEHERASTLLELARVTPDLTKRTKLYYSFQQIFAEELPALPLFYPVYTYAVDQQVKGIRLGPVFDRSDRFNQVTQWYMVGGRAAMPTIAVETATATPEAP